MSQTEMVQIAKNRQDASYEFDREPVPQNKLYRTMCFASSYAGKHTAATEFVIGAFFIT